MNIRIIRTAFRTIREQHAQVNITTFIANN